MPKDDIEAKVQHFLELARQADASARNEAEGLFEELAPGILSMVAKVPPALRSQAVVVIADTQHSVAASIAREVLRHVPSGAPKMSEVGTSVMYFAQPRATIDTLFGAYGVPIPETWAQSPERGAVRLAFLLEDGLLYATDITPSSFVGIVGSA